MFVVFFFRTFNMLKNIHNEKWGKNKNYLGIYNRSSFWNFFKKDLKEFSMKDS